MKKVMMVFGTRPEAIKMAPVIHKLEQHSGFEVVVCTTGQHREMLDQVIDLFDIKVDYDLAVMMSNQSLCDIASSIIGNLDKVVVKVKPDIILVHGDTTTTISAALCAFYNRVMVGHVEAGLRTWNLSAPWPEEANRVLTSCVANLHFAPTEEAKKNLLRESVSDDNTIVTGNTVIDSLLYVKNRLCQDETLKKRCEKTFSYLSAARKLILVTGHRRESFGGCGGEGVCNAIRSLAHEQKGVDFVYPVHLSPNVRAVVNRVLSNISNVYLIDPLEYHEFVYLMSRSYLILTDSGGVQEEGPSLGKPVLVTRDTTERPEAVSAGTVRLVGTNELDIITAVTRLLEDREEYSRMSTAINPYGDGKASDKIVDFLYEKLMG